MVSTHLKNISQIGLSPQVGVKIKNIWNHQPDEPFFKMHEMMQHIAVVSFLGSFMTEHHRRQDVLDILDGFQSKPEVKK